MDDTTVMDTSHDTNEVLGRLDTIASGINGLTGSLAALQRKQPEIFTLIAHATVITNVYTTHTRFYLEKMVMSAHEILAVGGVTFVLHVGGNTYRFHFDISLPNAIEFPLVLDRGVDVWFTFEDAAAAPLSIADAFIHMIGRTD